MAALDVVTPAFGYTGSQLAELLLDQGREVRTLTRRSAGDHPLGGRVDVRRLSFDDDGRLAADLQGVDTLYSTYWRRFPDRKTGFDDIVANYERLLAAARRAGVRRIVQFSVTNAGPNAPTLYFRAKWAVEEAVIASGLSYAIVRPTLLCGRGDILIRATSPGRCADCRSSGCRAPVAIGCSR